MHSHRSGLKSEAAGGERRPVPTHRILKPLPVAGDFEYSRRPDGTYLRKLTDGSQLSGEGPEIVPESDVPEQIRQILRNS